MVTFALPGDDVAEPANSTPRSKAPLAFSQRSVGASPYGSFAKRAPTPHTRKTLLTRDDAPSGGLNRTFGGARNIFRSSIISDSPPAASVFSPNIPNNTPRRTFEPRGTLGSARTQRDVTAQATPHGVAAKAKDKDLFPMRISSPPPDLTGEALTQKVPKEWDQKRSIYADQFLSHLCPSEFDEDQRRQFFCILDLRRLKYTADEVFVRKGWKLNVLNFAKEFEKTRGIILLHYGLYEFRNVKPSKEILQRWRRDHGLPEPEDEDQVEAEPTPSKLSSVKKKNKRKADDDDINTPVAKTNKRRATEVDTTATPAAAAATTSTPFSHAGKNKRKVSVSEDTESQPAKLQKPASGARSLFEAAANKAAGTPTSTAPSKPSSFGSHKHSNNNLFRSVLTAKAEAAQAASNGNPFAYLSDNSSAKNSGIDADAESESDSESQEGAEDVQNEEPSAKRPAITNAVETSSDAGTRESTPGRSLFDRVTKDNDGKPVRAETPVETPAPVKDQTWHVGTTPIKFAPSAPAAQLGSLFGAPSTAPTSTGFAPKSSITSTPFGGAKLGQVNEKEASPEKKNGERVDKDGGESDKENDSQASNKPTSENKAAPPQPAFGSSLFAQKPSTAETPKDAEPAKPTSTLFGSSTVKAPTASPSLFGSATPSTPSVLGSSALFGAKPADDAKEPEKSASSDSTKPVSLFANAGSVNAGSSNLFNPKPASTTAGSLFANNASATSKPLFGNASTSGDTPAPAPAPAAEASSTPRFGFGTASTGAAKPNGITESASKPIFGAPKSPPASAPSNSMFDGSPMKQDDKSPAKPLFGIGNNNAATTAPSSLSFSFGNPTQGTPSGGLFGGASKPADTANSGGLSFGTSSSATAAPPSGGFNFNFGGGTSNNAPSNPFTGGNPASQAPPAGGSFTFGNAPAPFTGSASPFQFGGNAGSANGAPMFGAASSTPATGPGLNFGDAPAQAQQSLGSVFGNNNQPSSAAPAFNLQPPSGGFSTGTSKSPFPGRKILPLKRRV